MPRALPVLLLVLALLVPVALAQPGRGGTTPATTTPATPEESEDDPARDEDRSDGRGRSDDRRRDDEDDHRPIASGGFALSAAKQVVQGDFVDFSYNQTGLTDFTVDGLSLFDVSVVGRTGDNNQGVVAKGAQLRLDTPHYRLRVHDNPSGVVKLQTEGVATLRFRGDVNLTQFDGDRVGFTLGNLSGTLRGSGARIAGPSVIVDGDLLILVHTPVGGFDTHRKDIAAAVGKRQVGAEASFNKGRDDVEADVVSYGNVTIKTLKAETGNLTVLVEGHGFDGRVVVLNVDRRILGAESEDALAVLFDNESITRADGIADVLDPDDDGLNAEYYVIFDPEQGVFQAIVSIPHYSVHTLSVTTLIQAAVPSIVAGVMIGLLVLAASGVVLFRRPKQ